MSNGVAMRANEPLHTAAEMADDDDAFHTSRCDDDDDEIVITEALEHQHISQHETIIDEKLRLRQHPPETSINGVHQTCQEHNYHEIAKVDNKVVENSEATRDEGGGVGISESNKETIHHVLENTKEIVINNPTLVVAERPKDKTVLPLHGKWSIWFDHPKAAPPGSDWKEKLKLCGTFQSVEGFWRIFNNLKPSSDLSISSNYSVFRYGIEPSWEDPLNCDGGKFVLTIPKKEAKAGRTTECWLFTVLAVIGETMDIAGNEVNGAVVSIRKHEDRISLWLRRSEPRICVSIGERWKKVLNLDKNMLKFVTHRTAAATGRSFRNESQFAI